MQPLLSLNTRNQFIFHPSHLTYPTCNNNHITPRVIVGEDRPLSPRVIDGVCVAHKEFSNRYNIYHLKDLNPRVRMYSTDSQRNAPGKSTSVC